jgi:acetoin utilization deacetylase AcuC-like enzyme
VRSPFGVRVPDRVDPLVAGFIEANAVPTAYITHPSFLLHEMGPYHPECPDRLTAIGDRLISAGLDAYLRHYSAPAATVEQLGRVHSRDYIAMIEAESPMTGLHFLDPDTAMNPHSLAAARHAAGAVVLATELLLSGECRNAFCAVRPPGHHAERERAMGFCMFNNVDVGGAHALAQGLERVAVDDFDVSRQPDQVIFSNDPRVLMVRRSASVALCGSAIHAEHGQHHAISGTNAPVFAKR